jgi:hypothetical protein
MLLSSSPEMGSRAGTREKIFLKAPFFAFFLRLFMYSSVAMADIFSDTADVINKLMDTPSFLAMDFICRRYCI